MFIAAQREGAVLLWFRRVSVIGALLSLGGGLACTADLGPPDPASASRAESAASASRGEWRPPILPTLCAIR